MTRSVGILSILPDRVPDVFMSVVESGLGLDQIPLLKLFETGLSHEREGREACLSLSPRDGLYIYRLVSESV